MCFSSHLRANIDGCCPVCAVCVFNLNKPDLLSFIKWCESCLFLAITCGEDDILGNKLMIHNGELGQFNLVHPCYSIVSSSPVELNVICSVTI